MDGVLIGSGGLRPAGDAALFESLRVLGLFVMETGLIPGVT